jgi:hypothetical protein
MGETPPPEQGLELSRRYVDVDVDDGCGWVL